MGKGRRCRPIIEGWTDSYYPLNEHHLTLPSSSSSSPSFSLTSVFILPVKWAPFNLTIVIIIVIDISRGEMIHTMNWLKMNHKWHQQSIPYWIGLHTKDTVDNCPNRWNVSKRMTLLTSGKSGQRGYFWSWLVIRCISTVMLSQAIEQEAGSTSYVSLEQITQNWICCKQISERGEEGPLLCLFVHPERSNQNSNTRWRHCGYHRYCNQGLSQQCTLGALWGEHHWPRLISNVHTHHTIWYSRISSRNWNAQGYFRKPVSGLLPWPTPTHRLLTPRKADFVCLTQTFESVHLLTSPRRKMIKFLWWWGFINVGLTTAQCVHWWLGCPCVRKMPCVVNIFEDISRRNF